ncbi:MAG TPA: SCP2 sterol-binding domain-containing protein [Trueperaceae bacterium]|nr:SCP2 sterol-binding domain-containing protein [Trueperaceae bacterium]
MNAKDLLMRVPETVRPPDGVRPTKRTVVQYSISEPVYHVLENGEVVAVEGTAPDPDVTIKVGDDDLIDLLGGRLSPAAALFTGRLKVRGDIGLAQRLIGLVDREKLAAVQNELERA